MGCGATLGALGGATGLGAGLGVGVTEGVGAGVLGGVDTGGSGVRVEAHPSFFFFLDPSFFFCLDRVVNFVVVDAFPFFCIRLLYFLLGCL